MLNELLKHVHVVQEIDTQMLQLRHKLAQLDTGKAVLAARDQAVAELATAEEAFHKFHSEQTDAELELKSVEEKKKKFEKRLFEGSIHNPKELENTRKEVEALGRQRAALDEQILAMWESVDERKKTLEEAKQRLAAAEEALAKKQKAYAEVRGEIEKEYRTLHAARQQVVAKCDAGIIKKYDIIRERHAGVGIASAKEGLCTACGSPLPVTSVKALHDQTRLVTCDSCNRLMFLDE